MAYLARHDFLTGLPNRVLLTERPSQATGVARRHRKQAALLFLDLDDFKKVNDLLGHAIGDQLLQSVACRLVASVRDTDTVFRHGDRMAQACDLFGGLDRPRPFDQAFRVLDLEPSLQQGLRRNWRKALRGDPRKGVADTHVAQEILHLAGKPARVLGQIEAAVEAVEAM